MGKWDNLKPEQQESIKEALKYAEEVTKPEKKEETSLTRRGAKRQEYGKSLRPPLEGLDQEQSDKVREFVAHVFSGLTQKKACEKSGLDGNNLVAYRIKNSRAFEQAEADMLATCHRRYHQNLWVIRTALSEAGPRAVMTMIEVMDSKKVQPGTRLKAAETILKIVNVTGEAANGSEKVKFEIAEAIKDARKDVASDSIVDVEDAEVIEDGSYGTDNSDEHNRGSDYCEAPS